MSIQKSAIQRLQDELAQWSDAQFGQHRPATRPIRHLRKEVDELLNAPDDANEYADCLLLLLDAYRMSGGSADDLVNKAFDKLAINKTRQWGEPDEHGVVEHVRSE